MNVDAPQIFERLTIICILNIRREVLLDEPAAVQWRPHVTYRSRFVRVKHERLRYGSDNSERNGDLSLLHWWVRRFRVAVYARIIRLVLFQLFQSQGRRQHLALPLRGNIKVSDQSPLIVRHPDPSLQLPQQQFNIGQGLGDHRMEWSCLRPAVQHSAVASVTKGYGLVEERHLLLRLRNVVWPIPVNQIYRGQTKDWELRTTIERTL